MNIFNAAEVIDMGIEKEKKRRDFYDMVSKKFADNPDMKELFTRLRDWEETHIKKFSEIRNTVEEDETFEGYPGELEDYIGTLVDETLYSVVNPESFSQTVKNPVDAVKIGMTFEKDAILFFSELIPSMNPVHTEKVRMLIDEEKLHLVYLSRLKTKFEIA